MTFSLLAHGIGLFVAALITHVLLWNMFRVKKEVLWLAVVFVVIPLVALAALRAAGYLETATSTIAIGLLHMALAVAYIQTYPALREDIPSVHILMRVHSQPNGLSREEILGQLDGARFLETKVEDLENDAFVVSRGGILHLTPVGTVLAVIFGLYRRLLGIQSGKG